MMGGGDGCGFPTETGETAVRFANAGVLQLRGVKQA
jgi:hypothetical protein